MSRLIPILAALLLGAAGLAQTVRLMTHDSFDLPADLLERFTDETGIEVVILPAGDAGQALNRAILTRTSPVADLLFGVDDSLLGRALDAELFVPYRSPHLDRVPEELRIDPGGRVTPVDAGYIVFNLDLDWFEANDVPLPDDLDDLLEGTYRDLTVVSDPATSSPGLAFLLTTVARYGEAGWLDYWASLRDNGLQVTDGWSDAYYTYFTRYGGDRPIVLSYATSPAAEVIFAERPLLQAPTGNLLCGGCAWRQVETVGILAGSDSVEAAGRFIDFLLSDEVQRAIPESMFVYPAVGGVPLPAEFGAHADVPTAEQTATLDPGEIEAGVERWLDAWTRVVMQGASPDEVR